MIRTIISTVAAAAALALLVPAAPAQAESVSATFGRPKAVKTAPVGHCKPQARSSRPVSKSLPRTYRKASTWIYGDSITWQSRTHLKRTLPGREAVDAHWGRNTQHGVNALLKDLRRYGAPKTVVIALGTNDMVNVPAFEVQVARVIRILPRKTRIVWVNTYSDANPAYNAINRVIRAHSPRVTPVSWASRNAPVGDSPLLMDGLHVNGQGCDVRNNLIRKAVTR